MKKRILSIVLTLCMLLSVVPIMTFTASAAEIGTCPDCGETVTWEDYGSEHVAYCQNCDYLYGNENAWKRHPAGEDGEHCNVRDCQNAGGGGGNQGGTCPDCHNPVKWEDQEHEHMAFCEFCQSWKSHPNGEGTSYCNVGDCANSGGGGGSQGDENPECPICHQPTAKWMVDNGDTSYHFLTCTNSDCEAFNGRIDGYSHSNSRCNDYNCNASGGQITNRCGTFDQLKAALESDTNGLDVYVNANITLTGDINVKGSKILFLCNYTLSSDGVYSLKVANTLENQAELDIYGGESYNTADEYNRGSLVCPIKFPAGSDVEDSKTIYILGGTVNIHSGFICGIIANGNGTLNISGGYIDNVDILDMNVFSYCNTNLTGGYYTLKAEPFSRASGTITDYAADGYGAILFSDDELITVNQKVYRFQIVQKIQLISASNLSGQGGVKFYEVTYDSLTKQFITNKAKEITSVFPDENYYPEAIDIPGYSATITFDYDASAFNTSSESGYYTATTQKSSITATANYTLKPTYTLTCATCTNGSVSVGTVKKFASDETVTVTPTADSGYAVDKVYYNDGTQREITPSSGVYSFTMPAKAVTVSATFAEAKTYVCYIDKNKNGTFDGSDVKYDTIAKAITAAGTTDTTIRLIADVTENVVINAGQTIILDLNGYVLKGDGTTSVINNNGTLTITDSDTTAQTHKVHNFKVGDDGLWTLTTDDKTVDFESLTSRPATDAVVAVKGGCITGGTGSISGYTTLGGGIYNAGTLTFQGGNIVGNKVVKQSGGQTYGGGVYNVANKSFTMSAGYIIGNSAMFGGGVYNCGDKINGIGVFDLEGGVISYNLASYDEGGGGGIYNGGTFNITDGTIANNATAGSGGAVFNGQEFTMSGGSITGNNASYGGGIFLEHTLTMTGGSITGNTATELGGGVLHTGIKCIVGGTAQITGNTADSAASNLALLGTTATLGTGDNAPKTNMSVGVTLLNEDMEPVDGAFTENGVIGDLQYFNSDNSEYIVVYNNEKYLELSVLPEAVKDAEYYASLTLHENIDINFSMEKLGSKFDLKKLVVTVDGGEPQKAMSLDKDGNVVGILKAVSPHEMGKSIHIVVTYDGVTVKDINYSILDYCNAVYNAQGYGKDSKLGKLCTALINYGKWAEDYYNEANKISSDASTVNAAEVIDFSGNSIFGSYTAPKDEFKASKDVTYAAGSLSLGSTITLNFYVFTSKELSVDNINILNNLGEKVNPKNITVEAINIAPYGAGYIIKINNIGASKLSRTYTLTINGVAESVFKIVYGVQSYCYNVQDETGDVYTTKLKTLCKAIYNYAEAAKAYSAK